MRNGVSQSERNLVQHLRTDPRVVRRASRGARGELSDGRRGWFFFSQGRIGSPDRF